mgnify:CR=1 FL=1
MDGQGEVAVDGEAAAVWAGGLATRLIGCPGAAGECWRRHRVLSAQRCLCSLCLPSGHCSFAACAGVAGGVATAHSGRCRENMAL